jgi:hypothetical protein
MGRIRWRIDWIIAARERERGFFESRDIRRGCLAR